MAIRANITSPFLIHTFWVVVHLYSILHTKKLCYFSFTEAVTIQQYIVIILNKFIHDTFDKKELSAIELLYSTLCFSGGESGRWDSRQRRHSVWGCLDLVMLEHGNGKHHLSYGISNSQFTFLPQDFLHFCQYHCSWGLDFVNIKIWVLTSKRVVDLFTQSSSFLLCYVS